MLTPSTPYASEILAEKLQQRLRVLFGDRIHATDALLNGKYGVKLGFQREPGAPGFFILLESENTDPLLPITTLVALMKRGEAGDFPTFSPLRGSAASVVQQVVSWFEVHSKELLSPREEDPVTLNGLIRYLHTRLRRIPGLQFEVTAAPRSVHVEILVPKALSFFLEESTHARLLPKPEPGKLPIEMKLRGEGFKFRPIHAPPWALVDALVEWLQKNVRRASLERILLAARCKR